MLLWAIADASVNMRTSVRMANIHRIGSPIGNAMVPQDRARLATGVAGGSVRAAYGLGKERR